MSGRLIDDVAEIGAKLAAHLKMWLADYLPNGRFEGGDFRCGSIRGEPGRRLLVRLAGPDPGSWIDFSQRNLGGDALDLVGAVLFQGDRAKAVRWTRSFLDGSDSIAPVVALGRSRELCLYRGADGTARAWRARQHTRLNIFLLFDSRADRLARLFPPLDPSSRRAWCPHRAAEALMAASARAGQADADDFGFDVRETRDGRMIVRQRRAARGAR